jgi:hypothetical protein
MHLMQIFIPLGDNQGRQFDAMRFGSIRQELLQEFGGVTIYPRAPADGLWRTTGDKTREDRIVIYEVMASILNKDWWSAFRIRQEIRTTTVEIL